MNYLFFMYAHLLTVSLAFVVGTYTLIATKGNASHRACGRIYAVLMLTTATITLFMPATSTPALGIGYLGVGHIFSFIVYVTMFGAVYYARVGNIKKHRQNILGSYFGALLIAGSLSFTEGRFLHSLMF